MFLNLLIDKLKWKINVKDNSSVSLLLKDRPEIAKVLYGHDSLKRWLIEQFSGKATKFPILWDPKEPEASDAADHCYPLRNKPAKIRVSRNMSGLDQLSGIIFELFNIRYHKEHRRLWKKACKGEIGKQEYSFRSCRFEYKAWKKSRRFFKKHSSVFAAADDSNEVYNRIMSLTSFLEVYAIMKERDGGETYFEKLYEESIVPNLLKKRDIMVKMKHLFWIERIASLTMACAIGFMAGAAYPRAFLLYPAAVICIGACTKIWVHHHMQKLKKSEE